MSDSSRPQSDDGLTPEMVQGWLTSTHKALDEREQMCKLIAKYADRQGLDCDWQFVNRHLKWFTRWHNGQIRTGYLMGRTGVKRKTVDIEHWSK